MTAVASGDFVGIEVRPDRCAGFDGLIWRVYAVYDNPADEQLSVGNASIETTARNGFWQAPLGQDTAPLAVAVDIDPMTVGDTFVTIGRTIDDGTDSTSTDPQFVMGFDTITGGWFNTDRDNPNGQMLPDVDGRVLLLQFRLDDAASSDSVSGSLTVFWKDADTGEAVGTEADFTMPAIGDFVCPTDFDADLHVDAFDLAFLLSQWGTDGEADANCDGVVDADDLAAVLADWGPCAF